MLLLFLDNVYIKALSSIASLIFNYQIQDNAEVGHALILKLFYVTKPIMARIIRTIMATI